ncbi:MAG: hypothetical protein OXG35_28880 [Acidobacteria bacterium]|nr:hypothetical protein [Acidobacteriota bacterium]
MFDSLTIARQLTEAGIDREHADAIAAGIRQAAEHGDHVTPAMLDSRLDALDARLDAGLAKLRADLTWRMLAVAGLVIAAIRLIP